MSYSAGTSSSMVNGRYHKKSGSGRKSPESNKYNIHPHSSSSSGYVRSSSQEYEHRIQSLTSQLAVAQSQVMQLETELANLRPAKAHAEHGLMSLTKEYGALKKRNAEVIEVMKTLEMGVEALQSEKNALVADRDEFKAKLEASEKNTAMLTEQVNYLNERNGTLSKKCVDLLDGSKDIREKNAIYEDELKRIKPNYEDMKAKFDSLVEQNKNYSTRLNMFEMRERIWIKEKSEFEQRHRETIDRWQKNIEELRQKHEADLQQMRSEKLVNLNINGATRQEVEKLENYMKDLESMLSSVQRHHQMEMDHYVRKINQLEQKIQEQELDRPTNAEIEQQKRGKSKDGAEGDDDDVILLDDLEEKGEGRKENPNKNAG